MKINQFLSAILLLTAVFFLSSCENYSEEVLNGTVQIEMVESPANRSMVNLGSTEKIQIKFTSQREIKEAHASLYTEDADLFDIDGDNVRLKGNKYLDNPLLNEEAGEAAIFHIRNTDVGETTYTFEQEVDLTAYPEGTCFVLFGMARGAEESDGYDSQGIYFCKRNQ